VHANASPPRREPTSTGSTTSPTRYTGCPIRTPCASPQLLATFPALPGTFAVDSNAIYGTVTGTRGFVYALAKPP
jgi:hypothetical protein